MINACQPVALKEIVQYKKRSKINPLELNGLFKYNSTGFIYYADSIKHRYGGFGSNNIENSCISKNINKLLYNKFLNSKYTLEEVVEMSEEYSGR